MSTRAVDTSVEVAMLCRLLGDWSDTARTLPDALAMAIGELINASALRDGAILPSQRALAEALGVSRVTVAEAYDLLGAEDLVATRHGSGSRVRSRPGTGLLGSSNTTEGRLASHAGHQNLSIDLTSGALPGLAMVAETLASLRAEDLGELVAGDGYYPAGLPVLREAIAARYTRDGWPTDPGEVLVTGGAQQAVWLIAHTFVSSGDEVVVEDPTYRGALEAFRACGAQLLPVPMAPTGLDVAHLARLLESRRPRLLYVQPSAHNPTGVSMPRADRLRLAELVRHHNLLTVEDSCTADVLLDRSTSRPLWGSLLPGGPVLTVGTASKLLWGGLRVGWIRGSRSAIARLTEARKAVDIAGPVLDQLVTARLLARDDEALDLRHAQLTAALDRASGVLAEVKPHWTWTPPSGGTGLWVDTGTDAVALAERGRRQGVRVVPGPTSSVFGGFGTHLRLPYWHPADQFREGLLRLK
ncbi:PLP-dependent aminotransferase family protein [Pengzhenrongella phosphoraccumulans]|uniref:aminotransferase-like domain-containing protein n=1 Tax=Pengzhenrongella phosphoraccumulans TaxID=3114394 RepID=UPI0038910469